MGKISQVKSQDGFPVTIRKLMRLGNAFAVTLPPKWVRSFNPGTVHYLAVRVHPDNYVTVCNFNQITAEQPFPSDPDTIDRP